MAKMKDSGIDWIGEIPEEWEVTKFKYFFNTNKGLSITKENLVEVGVPVISYGQIHSKYGKFVDLEKDTLPFVSESFLANTSSLLQQGDFVFADTSEDIVGSGNFSTRLDDNGYLFAGYHTIKASLKKSEQNDFRYFMHLFDSLLFRRQVQSKVSGIKVFSITQSILQNCDVLVPSLVEQKCIADYLDKKVAQLDKVKALLEEQIATLQDYRQSLIYETVTKGLDKTAPLKDSSVDWIGQIPKGWGVKPLKYLIEFQNGYAFDSNELNSSEDTGYKVIRIGDFKPDGIDFGSALSYSGENVEKLEQYKIKSSQILIAMSGATVGKISFVPQEVDEVSYINQRVGIIDSGNYEMNRFTYYWLSTKSFTEYIILNSNGSAQPNISGGEIGTFLISLPSRYDINSIIDFLDKKTAQINQMIAIKQKQIDNINQQRQTMIYDFVTGKRRV